MANPLDYYDKKALNIGILYPNMSSSTPSTAPTTPTASATPVVTSKVATNDLKDIENQHKDIVTGITNQSANNAQLNAQATAQTNQQNQQQVTNDNEAKKLEIQAEIARLKKLALSPETKQADQDEINTKDLDKANKDRLRAQKDYEAQSKSVIKTIDSIRNGTIPLTPAEQAQIDGLKQQFGVLIEQQKLSNINSEGLGNIRGYQTGAGEYDPTFQAKTIGSIVTAGLNKVADLNIKMSSAVAELTTAFQTKKLSLVKEAWSVYQDAAKQRQDTIAETIAQAQERIKKSQEEIEAAKTQNDELLAEIGANGAPPEVIQAVNEASTFSDKIKQAGEYLQKGTGIVAEYAYYKSQAKAAGQVPVDFNTYQNMDANRKISIAKASTTGGGAGSNLNSKQLQYFNSTTTKFQADPFINTALKGQTAIAIADQVLADPQNATNQLKSLYVLVKNLDPDSAVREGEISLADKTQSYLQRFQTSLVRISEGRVISPDAASELALATKDLAEAWTGTAEKRIKQYKSQASGLGISEAFDEYLQNSEIGGQENVSDTLIKSEAEAQAKVEQIYESRANEIDQLINEYPDLSYTEILQVLGE